MMRSIIYQKSSSEERATGTIIQNTAERGVKHEIINLNIQLTRILSGG